MRKAQSVIKTDNVPTRSLKNLFTRSFVHNMGHEVTELESLGQRANKPAAPSVLLLLDG